MSVLVRPRARLVLRGLVVDSQERTKKDGGEYFATDLVIETPERVALRVRVWGDASGAPKVGSDCAIWVALSEAQYGADLAFDGVLSAEDLDTLASGLRVLSGK